MRLRRCASPLALLAAATAFLSFVDGYTSTGLDGCGAGGCGQCAGDCDSDADCSGDLRCHFRSNGSTADPVHPCANTVAGCGAGGTENWDYCAALNPANTACPNLSPPTPAPIGPCNLSIVPWLRPPCYLPTCNPYLLGSQQGECVGPTLQSSAPTIAPRLASTGTCPSGGCEECEGICHSDRDCAGNLECFKRDDLDEVPNCGRGGIAGWNYCVKKLPLCDLSVPAASRPPCKIFKPPCDMDVPTWAQPPCEMPPTPMPTPRPTRSPTPRPTRRPTPPPPPTRRPTSRPTPTPPPPTILPVCDLRVAPWERPPCRLVLPPCNPLLAPSQQAACQVQETEVPTKAPTSSSPTIAPTVSLLRSTSTEGCGSNGCEECEGQCEFDSDCTGDLVCVQRSGFEHVRGCGGGGEKGWDYCAKPFPPCELVAPSTPCVDRDASCASWASGGECQRNPSFMDASCAKSCNKCASTPVQTTDPTCVDSNAGCASWASAGECQRNPAFMDGTCAKSCNKCAPTQRQPCSTPAPTAKPTSSPTGQLPLCDMAKASWERPPCVEPLPACQADLQLWEQAPCTPHWSPPLRPGETPVLPSRSGGGGRRMVNPDDE